MITFHWEDDITQEIWSGITLPSKGRIQVNVLAGRITLEGYYIVLKDPLSAIIVKKQIPKIINGEFWQISFSLTNYLTKGKYKIIVKNDTKEYLKFEFSLKTRKQPNQVFLLENKLICTNMNKGVQSIEFRYQNPLNNLLLQNVGKNGIKGAKITSYNTIKDDNLSGKTQKTITWWNVVQPSYLPLDIIMLEDKIDEFYVFNKIEYEDEPGLELSHPELNNYDGKNDNHYPIKVIRDALNHVHRNMRYVRQTTERGVGYALKYKRGDCTEYSAFFVTLLRKLGIKARLVSGMGRSSYNNWISHAFSEVYIYGTWIPIDTVKPPKPYLYIGNRGDLIGLNRINWLDKSFNEYKVKFMGYKGVKPKIKVTQKVTESGLKRLPTDIRSLKPKSRLKKLIKGSESPVLKYKLIGKDKILIKVDEISNEIQCVGIIAGSIYFGKIINLQSVSTNYINFELDYSEQNEELIMIFLDNIGQLKFTSQIDYLGEKL